MEKSLKQATSCKLSLNGEWKLKYLGESRKELTFGEVIKGSVPGDVTADLYKAGKIPDPYFGFNYRDLTWIPQSDFEYSTEFTVTEKFLRGDIVKLVFKGIDTFAEVYLNAKKLFDAENMFLEYSQNVKELLKCGKNVLSVIMRSTVNKMAEIDCEGYFGVFNVPRLFIRKAQCHFGWDWAPKICGYGIWEDVYLVSENKYTIANVNYVTDNSGNVTVHTELSYCTTAMLGFDGFKIANSSEEKDGDELKYYIYSPSGELVAFDEADADGKKMFTNLKVQNPRLWWPSGYGSQPLYSLRVELWRGGKLVSEKSVRFAFREIELVQKPTGPSTMGYCLKINGESIFVRGSNWVPVDCFTGTLTDEKYRKLITLSKNANMNMLRVWGGGIYEKEAFYDICDELGIMVWQDFMFACADIPEDKPEWVKLTLKECEYQIKRLRVHPSVVYWCGGNEKTGSCGLQISRGDKFVDYALNGLVHTFDRTRPYARQSPCSFGDVGNNYKSGETHGNSFEPSLEKGMVNYRKTMTGTVTSFYSECAIMGPCTLEAFKRFTPNEYMWPLNDFWTDRLSDNPYAAIHLTFAERMVKYSTELYGKPQNLNEFVIKGMLVHAEALRAEIDYARSFKGKTQGFMNWMYSDIWPTGTWAIVDYYCEPKKAYYAMKKAYEPLYATFVENKEGVSQLVVINDTLSPVPFKLTYGVKNLNGKIITNKTAEGVADIYEAFKTPAPVSGKNEYMFISGKIGDKEINEVYSPVFFKDCEFKNDYTYSVCKKGDTITVNVKANSFVRDIMLSLPNNEKYGYSDNYFDMQAGEEKTVVITGAENVTESELNVTDYVKEVQNV